MPQFVDSHCHLNMINDNTDDVISRAHSNNVNNMLNVCVDVDKAQEVIASAQRDGVYATVGQHPLHVKETNAQLTKEIIDLIKNNPKVIAIGETGLDYYRDGPDAALQLESFEQHIEAAKATGLPLVIHCRGAESETLSILKKHSGQIKFIMHCFGGDADFAIKCLDLGGYISFSGIITFKSATQLKEACKVVPLDRLLIETDSPYLAPIPHRGKTNEPAYVVFIAEQIAQIKGNSLEEIADHTTKNFWELVALNEELPS